MDVLVGVDLGTTACKVTVIDEDLRSRSVSSDPYGISAPQRGWAEQDPRGWGAAVDATLERALRSSGVDRHDTISLSFTGQMHSLVLLDARGTPLRPAILWADRRAILECSSVEEKIPDFADITGNPALPAFTLPQLLWVRRNEPDIYAQVSTVMVPKDYLRFRYTGQVMTDWTDASGTGMLDARTREWSADILSAVDVDVDLLPTVVDPLSSSGPVVAPPAAELQDARTAAGIGDQFAEALSAGLTHPGDVSISLGTSAVVLGVADHPVPGSFCHAPADEWLKLSSLHAGGKSLEWIRDMVAPGQDLASVVQVAQAAPAGSHGLLFLPFLMGERISRGGGAPGAFVGLSTEHTRADLVRSVLEGVAFELRRMHENRLTSERPRILILKGGGARSSLWCDIVSGVFDVPYRTTGRDAAYGAALCAGVSRGWWSDWNSVPELSDGLHESGLTDAQRLDEFYHQYCQLVEQLTPGRTGRG